VAAVGDTFRNLFAFLFTRGKKEQLLAEYVIREHHRGRPLEEILKDAHVVNTSSPEDLARLFDEPSFVHAIGEDVIAAHRSNH
jgi:hypothetical protein